MRYEAPDTIKAATTALAKARGTTRILAGGTDLMVQMRSGVLEPDLVVDIKDIPGMLDITVTKDGCRIGAAVSGARLGANPAVRKLWPGVVEAVELIGSTQIQGRATLVGNLCNASPAADSVPALIAADASARIVGPGRRRDIAVQDVATGPGKTSLKKGEFVASVFLPRPKRRTGEAYLRFIPRTEMDIAVVGAGVSLTLNTKGVCSDARVSLGAVAARVLVVDAAAQALVGSKLEPPALDAMSQACSAAASPIDDKRGTVAFRTRVAGVLARRAAVRALERALG